MEGEAVPAAYLIVFSLVALAQRGLDLQQAHSDARAVQKRHHMPAVKGGLSTAPCALPALFRAVCWAAALWSGCVK